MFVVNTTQLIVYSEMKVSNKNIRGYITKGNKFSANSASGDWYRITSNPYTGYYVKSFAFGDGYNFSSTSDTYNTEAKTSTDVVTGKTVPSSESKGNTYKTHDDVIREYNNSKFSQTLISDTVDSYSGVVDYSTYRGQISSGLNINNIRGVLGIPHQFLPSADPRIDVTNAGDVGKVESFGRVYSEKVLKYMPLLLITPGIPKFMSDYGSDQRAAVVEMLAGIADAAGLEGVEADDYYGKYYSLEFAYNDYFKYVNGMLRSAAIFLGIQNIVVDGKSLSSFNWLYDGSSINPTNSRGIGKFLGPYVGCVAFYADCGSSIQDSFSNGTTPSQLASSLNSLSDTGRELNFLVGNVGSLAGLKLNALTGAQDLQSNMEAAKEAVASVLDKPNIMSNILNKAQTILSGGILVFPEIWSDSMFGRSYSCQMKLVAPSGDKLSIYMNILVPIYHLLAMALPRQSIQQSYFSPFLLRCYYKGLFNVDMGIMTGLNITRGAEAEWSYDGIPTVAEVSFDIKDLYEGMFMSRSDHEGSMGIMSNIIELDYIANSCGININDQEVKRTIKLFTTLKLKNLASDIVYSDILGGVIQYFNQRMQNIFGMF